MGDNKQNPPGWPFKVLGQTSSWPMHGMVLGFASEVLKAPTAQRHQAALKMVERCFRMGARLATEFGLKPTDLMTLAQMQIEREVPGAKKALAAAAAQSKEQTTEHVLALAPQAGKLVASMMSFAKDTSVDVPAPTPDDEETAS